MLSTSVSERTERESSSAALRSAEARSSSFAGAASALRAAPAPDLETSTSTILHEGRTLVRKLSRRARMGAIGVSASHRNQSERIGATT